MSKIIYGLLSMICCTWSTWQIFKSISKWFDSNRKKVNLFGRFYCYTNCVGCNKQIKVPQILINEQNCCSKDCCEIVEDILNQTDY